MKLVERPAFDHCYRSISGDKVFQNFSERGFKLNPEPVIHPERRKCQFIHFLSPAGSVVYLEFIFRDLTLPKLGPEKDVKHAGFALRGSGDLRLAFDQKQEAYPHLNPMFVHRNYYRTDNEDEKLPGWNFITYGNPPVPGIEVWQIEYEPIPGRSAEEIEKLRKETRDLAQHPNGAKRVIGFIWKCSSLSEFNDFAKISGSALSDNRISLEGGTSIICLREADQEFCRFRSKVGRFLSVMIEVESLDRFVDYSKPEDVFEIFGRKAARIRLDDYSWDILAFETNKNDNLLW